MTDDKLMNRPIGRGRAVRLLADAYASKTEYVLMAPLGRGAELAVRLDTAGIQWIAYLDNGQEMVVRTDQAGVMHLAENVCPCAAVFTVPKTVPAAKLSEALDYDIPPDGSQDMLLLTDDQGYQWPTLFVDALDLADPAAAASIRTASTHV